MTLSQDIRDRVERIRADLKRHDAEAVPAFGARFAPWNDVAFLVEVIEGLYKGPATITSSKGCICPPGAEISCQRWDCGRKSTHGPVPFNTSSTVAVSGADA